MLVAGLAGAAGVGLSAWSAHGLNALLSSQAINWVATAGDFAMLTAPAIAIASALAPPKYGTLPIYAGFLLALGMVIFCGSLTLLAFTDQRWLGAVTPFGGGFLILGWLTLALAGFQATRKAKEK